MTSRCSSSTSVNKPRDNGTTGPRDHGTASSRGHVVTSSRKKKAWWVYLVRCADDTLYCGATNDLEARIAAHDAGRGARYTRGRGPVELLFKRRMGSRSAALTEEARIKRLPRADKLALFSLARRRPRR